MTLTMTGNRNITANYAINSYSLAITSAQRNGRQDSEPGFVQLWNFCYTDGDTGTGYKLYELERRHHDAAKPDDAHDDRQSHITANYAINSYSLAITSANGTVAKDSEQASYNYGTSVTLTATPGTGYSFTSWSGDTTALPTR